MCVDVSGMLVRPFWVWPGHSGVELGGLSYGLTNLCITE